MLVTQVIDKKNGKRWDVYKKSENEYFYKYYEFFSSCGWRYVGQIEVIELVIIFQKTAYSICKIQSKRCKYEKS